MITFELYRQLDIRLFQTVAAFDANYGSCARYILDGDSLILLGSNYSLQLNMTSRTIEKTAPMRNWDIETEAVLWFAEDSNEAVLIRVICNAYRYFLQMDPYVNAEAFAADVAAANAQLSQYDIRIFYDETGFCVYHENGDFSFEDAIELIMDVDENRMDNGGLIDLINEALFFRRSDRMDEAAVRLEKVICYADHTTPIYTDSVFLLAETYYFAGNYKRAIELYYRCNMEFIEDENDFYIHLGHALLDERMKKYERQIKIYYRCRIDAEYADTHRQQLEAASTEIADVFDEYEQTCLNMGIKKYAEYRNSLPVGADDIDELMAFEKERKEKQEEVLKRYKDIRLMEPIVSVGTSGKSIHELLSRALSLFMDGDYQQSFDIYVHIKEEVSTESDYSTWINYMLGRLYCIFDEPLKAQACLEKCDPNKFGKIYRQDDFFLLYSHVRIVAEDFESDPRYRIMVRGRLDNYFAQYDKEYNAMLRDRKLMKAYRDYEDECISNAELDFKDILIKIEEPEKKSGFFGKIKNIFGSDK